ncbi:hypothetical protein P6166_04680 [Stenotrophomonas sp. HITSZ_GD]|uniref:hypothetical protein n=1 Tax=Stenotrophomonas sp. HITSZ_GD TaxID=3037248 RepID=UPI00240E4F02|nr:hypothetical protein [Stenotrophomonas sp. HITSZ_GD]MDG2524653.1 hypothetical protein [Stenotrophomonas sp. HITSZ_GD]
MAQQHIQLGTPPAGTDGDTARQAFAKAEENFNDLYGLVVGDGSGTSLDERVDVIESAIALALGKNKLINGNFDFWQRGWGPFTVTGYGPDRWNCAFNALTGAGIQAYVVGAGDANFKTGAFACSVNNTGNSDGTNHFFIMTQKIENVNTFNGQTVSFSATVFNAGAAGRQIAVEFLQEFGTGGSATVTGISPKKFTLAAGINHISGQVTLPSTAGKTIGNANHCLSMVLWFSGGSSYSARNGSLGAQSGQLYIGEVQLERGTVPSNFEVRPLGVELVLCQRYCEKSFQLDVFPGTLSNLGRFSIGISSAVNADMFVSVPFKVTKRVAPAVALWGTGLTSSAGTVGQDDGSLISASISHVGVHQFQVNWKNTASRWGGFFHFISDAEIP